MFNFYRFDQMDDGKIPITLAVDDGSFIILWRLEKNGADEGKIKKVIRQLIQVFEENVVLNEDKTIYNPKKNIVVDAKREWTYDEMVKMMKDEWGDLLIK